MGREIQTQVLIFRACPDEMVEEEEEVKEEEEVEG